MRAVQIDEFGPPEVLTAVDVADPVAGPGQVVVDVAFASITFVETQVRAGAPPNPAMLPTLPAVLGNGVGGVVTNIGDGADPALMGGRVVSTTGGTGGYAERVAVAADGLHLVPDGLSLDAAVALLADGRTATALIEAAAPRPGETVLVEAAAGGVGSLLVQLAKAAGARVVATAGGVEKLTLARSLGADVTIDYRQDGWSDEVRQTVGAVDVVFDGVGGSVGENAFSLIRNGGRHLAYGMAAGTFSAVAPDDRPSVTRAGLGSLSADELYRLTATALEVAADGRLHPVIGQRVPLPLASEAHAAIGSRRTIGKTLLVPGAADDRVILRTEADAQDVTAIRAVNLAAFPEPHEADLVDALRVSDSWIPGLSWVAVLDGEVVGHALLTRCHVGDTPSLALAPVAVHPDHQRRGIGALATAAALDTARSRGEHSVIVLGHPEYYPRFGFTTASAHGIGVEFEVPDEALMALSLDGSPLPAGSVRYPAEFGV